MSADLAGALADKSHLEPFEGEDVLAAGIEIPGAAGGLRDAMKIEPRQFHAGDRIYVVLECDVAKIRFEPILSGDDRVGWRRVHILSADSATFMDGAAVGAAKEAIDAQKRKIEMASEAANGIGRIPYDDELLQAHHDGLHASGLVPGCVECEKEKDATETEAAEDAQPPDVEADAAVGEGEPAPISGRSRRKPTAK